MGRTFALQRSSDSLIPIPKLAVFDMDGTLIEQESLVVLAKIAGLEQEIAGLTSMAMNGELGFREAVSERVSLLGKHVDQKAIEQAANLCSYRSGVVDFIRWLKKNGCKTVLNTGGFDWLADKVAQDLAMDACFCNQMIWEAGRIVGVELSSLVDGKKKAENLSGYAQSTEIDLKEAVCFGDGANDLPMMDLVQSFGGIAVGVSAKAAVIKKADFHIKDFANVLELFDK